MVAKILSLLLASSAAHAYVTVLSPHVDCATTVLKKSVRGMRLTLAGDPTEAPAETLTPEEYSVEALNGVEKVRAVYAKIFRRRKMPKEEADAILRSFEEQDAARLKNKDGLDNTAYFVWYGRDGEPQGVVLATVVRKGEGRKLPLEKYVDLPDGNRVELERAFNSPGRYSSIVARETMMVVAEYLGKYFGSNDYNTYLLTDELRANHYGKEYGFTTVEQPQLPEMYRYLCEQKGDELYFRFKGHVEAAYRMAFQEKNWYPGGLDYIKSGPIAFLNEILKFPGMKDYIPNLAAQATILAAFRDYAPALAISKRLNEVGRGAPINDDFLTLWESRVAFNPIENVGDAAEGMRIIDEYLSRHPLDLTRYNDRAVLFLVYRLKILFATERFEEAGQILGKYKNLLQTGIEKMAPFYALHWNYMTSNSNLAEKYSGVARARLFLLPLLFDVSTSRDMLSTAVLRPEAWETLAHLASIRGEKTLRFHYRAIAHTLRRYAVPF